jgi:hypothetical protein
MSIEGNWYNELGSQMQLSQNGASITGWYQTKVGDAGGKYDLVGSIDTAGSPTPNGQAVAWVVVWNNAANGSSSSVTAWSGQYQIIGGQEEITTLWLLTRESPSQSDWSSTFINQDIFTRNPPNEVQAQAAARRGRLPHPS